MKKHSLAIAFSIAALSCLTACSSDLIIAEILQVEEQATIRTAYNLWYEDPMDMDTVNVQKGKIIPFGTAIEIMKATESEILFVTPADKKQFRLKIEKEYRLQSPEEYLRELLTTRTAEQLGNGLDPVSFEKAKRGIIEKGMTKQAVLLAYGPPCAFRTPDLAFSTWLYPVGYLEYKRVIFNNNVVQAIIHP